MHQRNRREQRRTMARRGGWLAAGLLLAACAHRTTVPAAADYLDEDTAATVTRMSTVCVLYSEDPARAANARDYLYLAPLGVNQSGQRSWWLWLGLWSTIDRDVTGGPAVTISDLARVIIMVDGMPMELDVGAGVEQVPGVGSLPYGTPVATSGNIFLPLTSSQAARIGRAASVSIRTQLGGEMLRWQDWNRARTCAPGSAVS